MWFKQKSQPKKEVIKTEPKKPSRLTGRVKFVLITVITVTIIIVSAIGITMAYQQIYLPFLAKTTMRMQQMTIATKLTAERQTILANVKTVNTERYATAVKIDVQTAAAQANQQSEVAMAAMRTATTSAEHGRATAQTMQRVITSTAEAQIWAESAALRAATTTANLKMVTVAASVRTATAIVNQAHASPPNPRQSSCTSAALILGLAVCAVIWRTNK